MRARSLLVAIAASLTVAACGDSSRGSSPRTTATSSAAMSATTANYSVSGEGAPITETTAVPPEVPKTKKERHHGSSRAVSQGAHVQTAVTINAAGDVAPSVVSVPSGVGIEIRVADHSSAAHTLALSVPSHPSVHLNPGDTGRLETRGLKDGTYRILVNGTPRGQLMVGAQGGP